MLLGKGGKATLYIPADLAYGVNGVPQAKIGPNATLVFEVELVDINPQDK
jgi:FKBP-type peptidyl-prolyl cis-trans isomerase